MSVPQFPITTSFLASQGNVELGQYIGFAFGPGLAVSNQGNLLGIDVVPAPPPVVSWPVSDALFSVGAAADPTRLFKTDESGQAPGTATTLFCTGTLARSFRLPDISGTALVSQDATGLVLVGQLIQDQGSNAGFQYSTLTANRAAVRTSQYGANTGVPGVIGFKSRGLTVGALASVAVGDVLWRATAIGVASDNASIPLAGTIGFEVPATGLFAQSVSPDFIIALASSLINSRRNVWAVEGLTGDLLMKLTGSRVRLKEGANAMQGVATLGTGSVTVANTLITASTRVMLTIQDGAAPLGTIYLSARIVGTSFTISSNNAADSCTVAWQLWEPAP